MINRLTEAGPHFAGLVALAWLSSACDRTAVQSGLPAADAGIVVPAATADHATWLRWLRGPPRDTIRHVSWPPSRPRSPQRAAIGLDTQRVIVPRPPATPRVYQGQAVALESHIARTGRALAAEFGRRFEEATTDSERVVFGALALAVTGRSLPPETFHEWIFSPDTVLQGLAAGELYERLLLKRPDENTLEPVDSALTDALVGRLMDHVFDRVPTWPSFWERDQDRPPIERQPVILAFNPPRIRGLPAGLVDRYRHKADVIVPGEPEPPPRSQAGLFIEPVLRLGPFVRVSYTGAGGMFSWVLAEVDGEWYAVTMLRLILSPVNRTEGPPRAPRATREPPEAEPR
jgi:hypothetical protein